jgi:hypothetical protein
LPLRQAYPELNIPPQLETVVARMLQRKLPLRFQTMNEVEAAISEVIRNLPS